MSAESEIQEVLKKYGSSMVLGHDMVAVSNREERLLPIAEGVSNGQRATVSVPYPPARVFEEGGISEVAQITRENQALAIIDHFEYRENEGIFVYHVGIPYPQKGFPTPQAVHACNQAKRVLAEYLRIVSIKELRPLMALFLLYPFKYKLRVLEKFIEYYNAFANMVLIPYFLKDGYMMAPAKQIRRFTSAFLIHLGIGDWQANLFAKILSHLIEYDTAYRFRIQDIMSETTADQLIAEPRQEVLRLIEIFKQREPKAVTQTKFINLARILTNILRFPKFRNAFQYGVHAMDFKDIQMDEADRYHCLKLDGYDFFGRKISDRIEEYNKIHNGNPPQMYHVGQFG